MREKSEKAEKVIQAIAAIIHADGTEGVTPTAIETKSGVSRGWIYKYLGGGRNDLIEFATTHLVDRVTGLAEPKTQLSREAYRTELSNGFRCMVRAMRLFPELINVYYRAQSGQKSSSLRMLIQARVQKHIDREITELQAVFGLTREQAAVVSAELTDLRLALAYGAAAGEHARFDGAEERAYSIFDRYLKSLGNPALH
jgi:hypothetical protein